MPVLSFDEIRSTSAEGLYTREEDTVSSFVLTRALSDFKFSLDYIADAFVQHLRAGWAHDSWARWVLRFGAAEALELFRVAVVCSSSLLLVRLPPIKLHGGSK